MRARVVQRQVASRAVCQAAKVKPVALMEDKPVALMALGKAPASQIMVRAAPQAAHKAQVKVAASREQGKVTDNSPVTDSKVVY